MSITFAHPTVDIPRDRWSRPLIEPEGGGKAVPYTRVSTLSKALDEKTALMKWKQRQTVIGLAARPDLISVAQSVRGDDRKLDEIVETAMVAAESERAANLGTALHALSEQVDEGADISTLPEFAREDMAAYRAAMAPLEVLAMERFIVCDELQAAGTFDRLVRLPDGRVMIADLKTGRHEPKYPQGATQQIAIYSRGHLYDPVKGRVGHLPTLGIDQEVGLLVHLPAGTGTCTIYTLDLRVGWDLARVSVAVRAAFKSKVIAEYQP